MTHKLIDDRQQWTLTNIRLHLRSPQRLSCDPCGVLRLSFSPRRCTTGSDTSGRALFLRSSPWHAVPSRTDSTTTVQRSAATPNTRLPTTRRTSPTWKRNKPSATGSLLNWAACDKTHVDPLHLTTSPIPFFYLDYSFSLLRDILNFPQAFHGVFEAA